MSARGEPTKEPAEEQVKSTPWEYWLKVIPLVTSAVSGILVLVPQATNIFGPFDYGAETLLIVFVTGIIVFAAGLLRSKEGQTSLKANRVIAVALIAAAPLCAGLLWYTTLRLPPEKEQIVQREIALGDTELKVLSNAAKARDHYRNALLIAPRRGSIRAKIQDAEERIRLKGD